MIKIPDTFKDRLRDAPESSYGVVTVTVILKNGQRFENVKVSWDDEILKIGQDSTIPFSTEDIADIVVEKRT